ncbi:MAG: SDR family oxidoreductase [Candidatus Tectomicrobia bacterium]|nr:SDR family oxidoreductase [Candidatus Tectomicrobia bacterium]
MISTGEQVSGLFGVAGKGVAITGGGSGIGQALGIAFASAGAKVALLDVNQKNLDESLALHARNGQAASGIRCDVTDPAGVERAFAEAGGTLGRLDALVNCAGITLWKPAEEHTTEEFRRVIEINLTGTFNCCQAAGRRMIPGGGGKIVNVSSIRSFVGLPNGIAAYASSKGGINMLTRQLATEWGKHKINVNAIAPGMIRTPLSAFFVDSEVGRNYYLPRIMLGRCGETDDLVGTVLFLASKASDYVTGQIIAIDGGMLAAG